jgi:salicylate hydroxylase
MQVLIVGAGIAGFSAAIACRRAGHEVHIYEKSSMNQELGAAIHLPPNASRGLLAWGFDTVKARAVICKKLMLRGPSVRRGFWCIGWTFMRV